VPPPPDRRRPPGRYDEPPRLASRSLAVLLSVLFVGLLVAVAWALYQRSAADDVALQVRGFEVLGDDAVRVEFDVVPPAGGTAWCLVRAREAGGTEVGHVFVPVLPREDGEAVRVVHELATTERAVTGEVPRCRPVPPPADERTAPAVAP
jgi:hypothetical protein